jgi:hypothetical protein
MELILKKLGAIIVLPRWLYVVRYKYFKSTDWFYISIFLKSSPSTRDGMHNC